MSEKDPHMQAGAWLFYSCNTDILRAYSLEYGVKGYCCSSIKRPGTFYSISVNLARSIWRNL